MSDEWVHPVRLRDRCVAAAGASLLAAFIVNPLDVVKTRMQARAAEINRVPVPERSFFETKNSITYIPVRRSTPFSAKRTEKTALCDLQKGNLPQSCASRRSWTVASCPGACIRSPGSPQNKCLTPLSMWSTLRCIVQQEGYMVLWRGVYTSMLISVPMVGLYMPLYDYLRTTMPSDSAYAPPVAGVASRTLAVFCVAPLELVRTRIQASKELAHQAARHTFSEFKSHVNTVGFVRSMPKLWTGFAATLARDVPFSAVYWASAEPIRTSLLSQYEQVSRGQLLYANLVAGTVAGAVAAAITTPFDVIKTRMQVSSVDSQRLNSVLYQVYKEEGWRGLFTGLGPRAARAAPACAIVISCYEFLKTALAEWNT